MAASLWVTLVDQNRKSCPNCRVKLTKLNPSVYSVGEYLRGKRRNIIDRVCRKCWDDECERCIVKGNHPIAGRMTTIPYWMALPWAPKLTPAEISLLDRICEFDIIPYLPQAVGVQANSYKDVPDSAVEYVQSRQVSVDEAEFKVHPIRDWCQENGVIVDWSWGGYQLFCAGFILPRRDGQEHDKEIRDLETIEFGVC